MCFLERGLAGRGSGATTAFLVGAAESAPYAGGMAAPVREDQELDLRIESLAYGGNGVARLNGFVVFVRRGLARRHRPRTRDQGEAKPRRGAGCRGRRGGSAAGRRAVRALSGVRGLPLPGPRVRGADRCEGRAGRGRATANRPRRRPAARADRPGRVGLPLPQQARVLVHADPGRPGARLPSCRALGRGARHPPLLADDRSRQRDPGSGARLGPGAGARGLRPGRAHGIPAPSRRARGPEHESGARPARDGSRASSTPRASSRRSRASPRCVRSTGRSTTGRRRSRTCRRSCSTETTRSRRSSAACASACGRTRSCRRTPRWPSGSTSWRASTRQLTGEESVYDLYCGIGTIGLTLARDALTVWGVEVSEESVACALENADLNGITNAAFFAGEVGEVLEDLRDRAGDPDVVVVDPPRAGLSGKALRRLGRLEAKRIVYVSCNPTTLAGNVKELRRRVGLPARASTAGGHVPAHAAHRDGRPTHAR